MTTIKQPETPSKPWYQSKALWINAGMAVAAAALSYFAKLPAGATPVWVATGINILTRLLSTPTVTLTDNT